MFEMQVYTDIDPAQIKVVGVCLFCSVLSKSLVVLHIL